MAICRCKAGFFPKPDTITGCGPQCTRDEDCSQTQNCAGGRCVNICESGVCGTNALCEPRNRRAICRCPSGYTGDPFTRCNLAPSGSVGWSSPSIKHKLYPSKHDPIFDVDQRILTGSGVSSSSSSFNSNPFTNSFSSAVGSGFNRNEFTSSSSFGGSSSFSDNPCSSFSCGSNAECTARSFRAVCTCRTGYEGDPYTGCRRSECIGKAFLSQFHPESIDVPVPRDCREQRMPEQQDLPQPSLHQSLFHALRSGCRVYGEESRDHLPVPARIHRRPVHVMRSVQ